MDGAGVATEEEAVGGPLVVAVVTREAVVAVEVAVEEAVEEAGAAVEAEDREIKTIYFPRD